MNTPSKNLWEGWVEFTRYFMTDGFIDVWRGDSADDPNKDHQSDIALNAFTTYLRLNGETRWKEESRAVDRDLRSGDLVDLQDEMTAEEFWENVEFRSE